MLLPTFLQLSRVARSNIPILNLNAFTSVGVNTIQTRTKVIYMLPHVTEVKRYRKNSFQKKTENISGRRVLMQRILKGKKAIAQ